jgi:RNA polymerase sigma-70 factor (ECF subfamily)
MKCIAQLPYGYRTILNLYAIDGFTHAEIAINLNITESTSRSQFNRAKNYLKKILNEINVLEDKKYNYEQK